MAAAPDLASLQAMEFKPLPSLYRRVVNLAWDTARAAPVMVARGAVFVPEEEAAAHLAVCRACPGGHFRAVDQTCTHNRCGCAMAIKVTLVGFDCPEGFWV